MATDKARKTATVKALLDAPGEPWDLSPWGWLSDRCAWLYVGPVEWLEGKAEQLDPAMVVVPRKGLPFLSAYLLEADTLEADTVKQVGEPPEYAGPSLPGFDD